MQDIDVDLMVRLSKTKGIRSMTVAIDNGEPILSDKLTPPDNSVFDLKAFTGEYHSRKLNISYEAVSKNDQLTFKHVRSTEFVVTPAMIDMFIFSSFSFMSERNESLKITGL